jgi:hypothetical protein
MVSALQVNLSEGPDSGVAWTGSHNESLVALARQPRHSENKDLYL